LERSLGLGVQPRTRILHGTENLVRRFARLLFGSWFALPGLFFFAAEKMGYEPTKCAVVEDSAFGVRGGIAAGMTVFGYAPRHDGNDLKMLGARVFHHMDELPRLLESMT